jgi:dipeptidyl aminopeptidase/acylaminoacyl peptidase
VFDASSFVLVDEEHAIVRRQGDGGEELVLVNTRTTLATPLTESGGSRLSYSSPILHDGKLHFITAFTDRLPAIEQMPLAGGEPGTIKSAGEPGLQPEDLSLGSPLTFPTRDGQQAHAFLYLPKNSSCSASAAERPPLLVLSHGGPTAATSSSLRLPIQYYTSRGWAVVDVNYRGSTGYGRAYRTALNGQWGILDVYDCEDVVRHLVSSGIVDGGRVAIRGGSAGGYTTLAALTSTHTFRAGASHYGIGDLTALARDTHKFESRYLESLLGDESNLLERSPINHLDAFNCPVIFFQGSDDRVVPPNQSQAMAAALRNKGIPVAYLEFAGEGHGFRDAKNIIRTVESEYAFFCRVFAIEPADTLPTLDIDNQEALERK